VGLRRDIASFLYEICEIGGHANALTDFSLSHWRVFAAAIKASLLKFERPTENCRFRKSCVMMKLHFPETHRAFAHIRKLKGSEYGGSTGLPVAEVKAEI
jgi:hypothetical protein